MIEVIVALTLFAISSMVLTQSFVNGLLCKTTLSREDVRGLKFELIRSALLKLPRNKIRENHHFYLTDNQTKFSWEGEESFCDVLNLYKVKVEVVFEENEKDTFYFFVRRPDWMTNEEKQKVSKSLEKTGEKDAA